MKRTTIFLVALLTVAVAVAAGTAVAVNGPKPVEFTFTGRLLADPASNATSIAVDVKTGNRQALQKLVGQSRNQNFAVDGDTEFLLWTKGKPSVVSIDSLTAGDLVTVHVRAARDSSILQIATTPASVVADRGGHPGRPHQALWLFRGTLNATAGTSSCQPARPRRQPPGAPLDARRPCRRVVRVRLAHHLHPLAGQGPDRHRRHRPQGRRPRDGSRPRSAWLDARAGRAPPRPLASPSTSRPPPSPSSSDGGPADRPSTSSRVTGSAPGTPASPPRPSNVTTAPSAPASSIASTSVGPRARDDAQLRVPLLHRPHVVDVRAARRMPDVAELAGAPDGALASCRRPRSPGSATGAAPPSRSRTTRCSPWNSGSPSRARA